MQRNPLKIVYCTPALYMAGGVERVLTLKANYFADHFSYDITIILTEGKDKPLFYPLSDKIKVINLDINFEQLWTCSFVKKAFVFLKKQRIFKKKLTNELMRIRPDITISLLRREINFINEIEDGSKKMGELHINKSHYRNFEGKDANLIKEMFSKVWMMSLVRKLRKLEKLVVLTEKDKEAWIELQNVIVIPNPLPFMPTETSPLIKKRVVAVGRYSHEKGFDLLLRTWEIVSKTILDWRLDIFGDGDSTPYESLLDQLHIDRSRCVLHGRTYNVQKEYISSSIFVCSSRFEGFGLAIVEAMACGLPVVSFDCPWGPRAIISDKMDGLLVEDGNIHQLALSLQSLMADEKKRLKMASTALDNVRRFQLSEIAERWRSVFEEVMNV